MRTRFFVLLLLTSVSISIHFAIDGMQSRGVPQAILEQSAAADLTGFGFGVLWIILSGIEVVVLALAHRIADGRRMRLLTYACAALYLATSLFAYLGYLELQSRIFI